MKKLIPILTTLIITSCDDTADKQRKASLNKLHQVIDEQSKMREGAEIYEMQCMNCHRNPNVLDLNKFDTINFYHKNGLLFSHINPMDKSKILTYLRVFKKDTVIFH